MFSNFNDVFSSEPKFITNIPDAVLKTISKKLPEEFSYIDEGNGLCKIDCKGVMKLESAQYALPEKAKDLFVGKKYTLDDIMDYAYNSQEPIELLPDDDGCYIVNGKRINRNQFVVAPMHNISINNGRLFIIPEHFPEPFYITLEGNGFSAKLRVQRQAINSINQIKFSSVDAHPLKISYIVDTNSPENKMKINLSFCQSSCAEEILAAKEIYNAFMRGTGTLCGSRLFDTLNVEGEIIPNEVIEFWHKIVDIEKTLGITFDMSSELKRDDIQIVDELYRCFVKKMPFRKNLKDCTLRGIGSIQKNRFDLYKEGMFQYTESHETVLFGVKIEYLCLSAIFGGMFTYVEAAPNAEEGPFAIKMEPVAGKNMYISAQFFENEDALEKVQKSKDFPNSFLNAEKLV